MMIRRARPFPVRLVSLVLAVALAACSSSSNEYSQDAHTAQFHIENAQRLYDGNLYRKALSQFDKALALDGENQAALLGRAWCLLFLAEQRARSGDRKADDTLAEAELAFQGLKEFDYEANSFKIDLGLGKVHVIYGDLYAARADMLERRALELTASETQDLARLTTIKERDTEYGKAQKYFKAVLALKDNSGARDNLTALIHLARIAVIQRDYAEALVYAERYLAQVETSKNLWVQSSVRFPRDKAIWEAKLAGAVTKEIEVRDLIADILYKLGRLELSEKELTQLIFLSPERPDSYLNRGIVRDELGQKKEALDDYLSFLRRAARLDMDPEDRRVLKATERIIELERELGLPSSIFKKSEDA